MQQKMRQKEGCILGLNLFPRTQFYSTFCRNCSPALTPLAALTVWFVARVITLPLSPCSLRYMKKPSEELGRDKGTNHLNPVK